jgi:hypothetical protein
MKTLLTTLLILAIGAPAQDLIPKAPQNISLNGILACADDSYVQRIFKTDIQTIRKLNMGELALVKDKNDADSRRLRDFGFMSGFTGDPLHFSVLPFPPTDPAPFCSILSIYYLRDEPNAHPYHAQVIVDPNFWTFDPNELFTHADQFTFKSGVFSNSSEVYLSATKGRTEIQLIATPKGLLLYRVSIKTPD